MTTKILDFPDRNAIADEAATWLVRLDGDESLSAEEDAALRQWLQRSPAHREQFERLATLWQRLDALADLAVPQRADQRPPALERQSIRKAGAYAAAAAVVLAIGALFVAQRSTERAATPTASVPATSREPGASRLDAAAAPTARYATGVGEQHSAALADGSTVMLNTDSAFEVDFRGARRDVHLLRGEAYFTVAKDPNRPFRVYAGGRRVQAVGTAFSVYMQGETVAVTVTEGRVALATVRAPLAAVERTATAGSAAHDASGAADPPLAVAVAELGTIGAGESVRIRSVPRAAGGEPRDALEVIVPAEMDRRLSWREGILTFNGEPLEAVVQEIGRYTALRIEYSEPSIRTRRIGGRFPIGATDIMFDSLEANFGLRVTRLEDGRVLLSSAND